MLIIVFRQELKVFILLFTEEWEVLVLILIFLQELKVFILLFTEEWEVWVFLIFQQEWKVFKQEWVAFKPIFQWEEWQVWEFPFVKVQTCYSHFYTSLDVHRIK